MDGQREIAFLGGVTNATPCRPDGHSPVNH